MRSSTKAGMNFSFILHLPRFLPRSAAWGPARPLNQPNRASGAGDGCDSPGAVRLRLAQATQIAFAGDGLQAAVAARSSLLPTDEETFVDPQTARAPLVLDRERVVCGEILGKHPVRDGPDPLVVVEVALPAAGEALDGVRMQPVLLDETARRIAGRQHRHQ